MLDLLKSLVSVAPSQNSRRRSVQKFGNWSADGSMPSGSTGFSNNPLGTNVLPAGLETGSGSALIAPSKTSDDPTAEFGAATGNFIKIVKQTTDADQNKDGDKDKDKDGDSPAPAPAPTPTPENPTNPSPSPGPNQPSEPPPPKDPDDSDSGGTTDAFGFPSYKYGGPTSFAASGSAGSSSASPVAVSPSGTTPPPKRRKVYGQAGEAIIEVEQNEQGQFTVYRKTGEQETVVGNPVNDLGSLQTTLRQLNVQTPEGRPFSAFAEEFGYRGRGTVNYAGGTASRVLNPSGAMELYDATGKLIPVDPNTPYGQRMLREPLTREQAYGKVTVTGTGGATTPIAQGTVSFTDVDPLEIGGQVVGVEGVVSDRQTDGKFYILPTNVKDLDRSGPQDRLLTNDEALKNLRDKNIHFGAYDTKEAAEAALAAIKNQSPIIDVTQGDLINEAETRAAAPYKEGERVYAGGTYYRGGAFYNIKPGKDGKPVINERMTSNPNMVKLAQRQVAVDAMPEGTSRERYQKKTAQASLEGERLRMLRLDRGSDKTHNFWDVLRAAGLGALRGFLTGGLGGAIGGGLTGAVIGSFDKNFDDMLTNQMFRIPRQEQATAMAQAEAGAAQKQVEFEAKMLETQSDIAIKGANLSKTQFDTFKDIVNNNTLLSDIKQRLEKGSQPVTEQEIAQAEKQIYDEGVRRGVWPADKPFRSGLTPGYRGENVYITDQDGRKIALPKFGVPVGAPVQVAVKGAGGKIQYVPMQFESQKEGQMDVTIGEGKNTQTFTLFGTQEEIGKQASRLLEFFEGQEFNAQKFNAAEINQAAQANANAINTRYNVLARAMMTYSTSTSDAVKQRLKTQEFNAISNRLRALLGSNGNDGEIAKRLANLEQADNPDQEAKAIQELQEQAVKLTIQAAGLVPLDDQGNPMAMEGVDTTELKTTIYELRNNPPKLYEPRTIKAKRLVLKPRVVGPPGSPAAPGTSPVSPTRRDAEVESEIQSEYKRKRNPRALSTSA